eukprot:m.58848 g.58848  ORF g.58848 m.58848 type:complete len:111 (-) comp13536_c0_seq1:1351-1683(-)
MASSLTLRTISQLRTVASGLRAISSFRAALAQEPHGGEGTNFKQGEQAREAVFIRKREEEMLRRTQRHEVHGIAEKDAAEYERLITLTTRDTVKLELKRLADAAAQRSHH